MFGVTGLPPTSEHAKNVSRHPRNSHYWLITPPGGGVRQGAKVIAVITTLMSIPCPVGVLALWPPLQVLAYDSGSYLAQ